MNNLTYKRKTKRHSFYFKVMIEQEDNKMKKKFCALFYHLILMI